jgi:DNA-binding response OmpR family regulator
MAKKILVVDDDPAIVRFITACLKPAGYIVISAEDGETALKKVKSESPDLVILDLMLPETDGWKIAQFLKSEEQYKRIPLIVLSGLIEQESDRGDMDQADFFMSKPFQPDRMLEKVQELLS